MDAEQIKEAIERLKQIGVQLQHVERGRCLL